MTKRNVEPNTFTFVNEDHGVQIKYQSGHFIDRPELPSLTYQDADTTLSFHREEIRTQQSELGTLVSVTLEKTIDAGATVLTLLVPNVELSDRKEQSFETFGIVTKGFGILPREGAGLLYERVIELEAVASFIPFL